MKANESKKYLWNYLETLLSITSQTGNDATFCSSSSPRSLLTISQMREPYPFLTIIHEKLNVEMHVDDDSPLSNHFKLISRFRWRLNFLSSFVRSNTCSKRKANNWKSVKNSFARDFIKKLCLRQQQKWKNSKAKQRDEEEEENEFHKSYFWCYVFASLLHIIRT